jgi:predicted N-acetyltransferase YhbS
MKIRRAKPTDIPDLTTLINQAFQVERFFVDGDRITEEAVGEMLDRGGFLLAEDEGGSPGRSGLAGCVYTEPRGERAYLGLLSVNPASQGNGVGSQLMRRAELFVMRAGCRFIDLRVVNLRETLIPYYRRLGYTETSTEPFPTDVTTKLPCHFIVMSKALGV